MSESKPRLDGLSPAHVLARAETAAAEQLDDELLIVDLGSGRYFGLCEVGSFVWSQLDGRLSLARIADEVASAFEVSRETALEDLLTLAQQLLGSDLAVPAGTPPLHPSGSADPEQGCGPG